MLKNVQLRIDNPCAERWGRMTPVDPGRFCISCKKTVVDFTGMTDDQVLQWVNRNHGSGCGRFRQDQLGRSLFATPERKNTRWSYWQYLLAGLLFSSEVSAQAKPAGIQITEQRSSGPESPYLMGDTIMAIVKNSPSEVIRGRIIDKGGRPVPFATVTLSRGHAVAANADGFFSITVKNMSDRQILTITALGYRSTQIPVNKLRADDRVQMHPVVLLEESVTLGEVLVVVRHKKKPNLIADTLSLIKDSLACIGLSQKALTVYPNPVVKGNSITIAARLDQPGPYLVQLFDISGTVLETVEVDGESNSGNMSMNIPASLVPGTYVVRLSHPAIKKTYTRQIVVL